MSGRASARPVTTLWAMVSPMLVGPGELGFVDCEDSVERSVAVREDGGDVLAELGHAERAQERRHGERALLVDLGDQLVRELLAAPFEGDELLRANV